VPSRATRRRKRKLNELEPWAYLKVVLECLPTQPASRIAELLPHRWHHPLLEKMTLPN
jgi:hypothetical protein